MVQTTQANRAANLDAPTDSTSPAEVRQVLLDLIEASFGNDRKEFDQSELIELAESILANGGTLIQPITVRPFEGRFQIIAGERRSRAYRYLREQITAWRGIVGLLGTMSDIVNDVDSHRFDQIPALVRVMTDKAAADAMLVENTSRIDLDPVEEGQAYKRRMDEFGLTVDEIARTAGKSVVVVKNRIKLVALRADIRALVKSGQFSIGYAAALADYELDENRQMAAFRQFNSNPSPSLTWFRTEVCAKLKEAQDSPDMFDVFGSGGSDFTASMNIEAPKWTPPPDPSKTEAPKKGRTFKQLVTYQIKFWNDAADQWGRLGKPGPRDRCLTAVRTLEAMLAIMPDHGAKSARVTQNNRTFFVYEGV